jgi:hypothetical protein
VFFARKLVKKVEKSNYGIEFAVRRSQFNDYLKSLERQEVDENIDKKGYKRT